MFPFIALEERRGKSKEVDIEMNGVTKSIIKSDTGFQ